MDIENYRPERDLQAYGTRPCVRQHTLIKPLRMKITLVLLLLIFASMYTLAQSRPATPLTNVPPKIMMKSKKHDEVQFSARLRPLDAKSHYTYFWEFGDGTFCNSRTENEAEPVHRYQKSGTYMVSLFATNNYDNGEAPFTTEPFPVQVKRMISTNWTSRLFKENDEIVIESNRNPRHDEEFVAFIGYRNSSLNTSTGGSLIIFFDEQKSFSPGSFSLTGLRTYHGEVQSSLDELINRLRNPNARTTLQQLKDSYRENRVLHFTNLPTGKEHFIFLTIKTSREMIGYTKRRMTMTACFLPDDPMKKMKTAKLDKLIVTSHDPNQIILEPNPIRYRRVKKTELTYRVRFKNTGEGPADSILVGINIPRQLNVATLKLKNWSPLVPLSSVPTDSSQSRLDTLRTADSIHFLFRNIFLPGVKQEGITSEQSQGFMEYSIRFNKRRKRIPFSSQAAIVFDRNKPDYTNVATAKFKGWSPGIIAGYNYSLSNGDYRAKGPLQIGYVRAPYAPSRPYLQFEAYLGILQQEDSVGKDIRPDPKLLTGLLPRGFVIDTNTARMRNTVNKKRSVLQVVPIHVRYNFNDWVGMGLGLMFQMEVLEKVKFTDEFHLNSRNNTLPSFDTILIKNNILGRREDTKLFASTNLAPFVDLQIGWVKTGPVLGLRYFRLTQGNVRNRFFLYIGLKL